MPIEWDRSRRVYIGNLTKPASKSEIYKLFEKYGNIDKLWIAREPGGFAFLQYTRRIDAIRAARALNDERCCGCRIKVALSISDLTDYRPRRSRRVEEVTESNQVLRSSRRRINSQANTSRKYSTSSGIVRLSSEQDRYSERSSTSEISRSSRSTRQFVPCSICSENMLNRKPTIAPCRHVFCSTCIKKATKRNNKCPICRADVRETQLNEIYINP